VTFDFKNPEALKALTTTLLQKDFGLQVEIPSNRLVPTLPLRLNYLLWMEDLIGFLSKPREEETRGVDIGCGASCIYPLLASTTNKWKMLATELDSEGVDCARRNVARNDLEEFITVKQVEAGTVLKGALNMDHMYDFTICNPPFFRSERDADSCSKSRSKSRSLPHGGKTGSSNEVVVQGGEVAFIQQMIQESAELRDMVKIYSTMVGQKSSLDVLKSELKKVGVASSTQTEFCQGNVTRWGLAWTFLPEVSLQIVAKKKKKEKPPMKYVVPIPDDPLCYTVSTVTSKLKALFTLLQIQYKECKRNQRSLVLEVTAHRNTWAHQRQQRRQQKKYETQQTSEGNNPCEMSVSASADTGSDLKGSESVLSDSPSQPQSQTDVMSMKRKGDEYENNNKRLKKGEDKILHTADDLLGYANKTHETGFLNQGIPQLTSQSELYSHSLKSGCTKMLQNRNGNERAGDRFEEDNDDNRCSENEDCFARSSPDTLQKREDMTERNTDSYLLNALVSVSKVGPDIIMEMVWLEGTHGRDAMHQVLQYIKNNLKIE
jgi:methyltransferase